MRGSEQSPLRWQLQAFFLMIVIAKWKSIVHKNKQLIFQTTASSKLIYSRNFKQLYFLFFLIIWLYFEIFFVTQSITDLILSSTFFFCTFKTNINVYFNDSVYHLWYLIYLQPMIIISNEIVIQNQGTSRRSSILF